MISLFFDVVAFSYASTLYYAHSFALTSTVLSLPQAEIEAQIMIEELIINKFSQLLTRQTGGQTVFFLASCRAVQTLSRSSSSTQMMPNRLGRASGREGKLHRGNADRHPLLTLMLTRRRPKVKKRGRRMPWMRRAKICSPPDTTQAMSTSRLGQLRARPLFAEGAGVGEGFGRNCGDCSVKYRSGCEEGYEGGCLSWQRV